MDNERYIHKLHARGADAVFRYILRLDSRLADAEARLIRAPQPVIDRLAKELAKTKRTLARQTDELLRARQLNHQLLRRVRELESQVERGADVQPVTRDSRNSSLPPSSDPPWRKARRTRSLRQKSGRKPGGQHAHPGTTLRQVPRPDHIIVHASLSCAACGASLFSAATTATTRRQVFDLADGRLRVTEHRAEARRCASCAGVTKAVFPTHVRAPAQYGAGVLARAVYFNLYQLLPVAGTCETLRDLFGCRLSHATAQRAARLCSGKLIRTEQRIKAAVRDSPIIGADETGLRVAGEGGWIHVARTDDLTHYGFDSRRGKAAMDEIGILPHFTGTLVRDGFSSYKWYERCRHSLCNAHLLRDLFYVEELDPAQKRWTMPLAELLLKIKRAAAESRLDDGARLTFLRCYDALVRRAERLNRPPPEADDDHVAFVAKRSVHLTPHRLIRRLQRRRDDILRFMADPRVPFDNNGSERDLRMIKLRQKVSGCFRTEDGARSFCRVRSYLSTARKQGRAILDALERALTGKPLAFISVAAQPGEVGAGT